MINEQLEEDGLKKNFKYFFYRHEFFNKLTQIFKLIFINSKHDKIFLSTIYLLRQHRAIIMVSHHIGELLPDSSLYDNSEKRFCETFDIMSFYNL